LIKRDLSGFKTIDFGGFAWVNIDSPNADILNRLLEQYPFHSLDMEDCLSKTQLPKIDQYDDYLFIILHFPRFIKEKKFSIPAQVGMFLGKDFLVTVHNGELKPINKLFNAFKEKTIDAKDITPAFLLYKILYSLAENIMLMMGKVVFNLEIIEEKVFDEKVDAVREVTELRHNIANLRRVVLSLKRVTHDLESKVKLFAEEEIGVYFSNLSDIIDKAWSLLEECKETIEIFKDTDFIISSDRTNKILALLTIVFTLSIPATIIGTFWGMNVKLPGDAEHAWTFLGEYTTFYLILFFSTAPVYLMYVLFKRLKWL
jgi:magnesium transporter